MDDKQIMDLYFSRDEQAIAQTEAKYGRLCQSIAQNILGNVQDAEECVNDTYAGLWNAIPPARPDNLMAFACRIARNQALKRLTAQSRQKRNRAMTVSFAELENILPDESIAEGVESGEIGAHVSAFLRGESEHARNVFIRKYYFFDSIDQISARYGFSHSKVKSMLYHTRNRLRAYLTEEGITI